MRIRLPWLAAAALVVAACGDDGDERILSDAPETTDCPAADDVAAALGTAQARFVDARPTAIAEWEQACTYDLGDNGGLVIWRIEAGAEAQVRFEEAAALDESFVEPEERDAQRGLERFLDRADDRYLISSISDLTAIGRDGFALFAQGQLVRGTKVCGTTFRHLTDTRQHAETMRAALPALLAHACGQR